MSCLSTKQSWSEIWAVIPRFAHCRQVKTWRILSRNQGAIQGSEWRAAGTYRMASNRCFREARGQLPGLLSKGRQVYVEGRITTRQYEAKDGSGKRYRTEIVARHHRLLGNRTNGNA